MDARIWQLGPDPIDDPGDRHQLLLDDRAFAGHVANDLDGRAIGREEAGLGRGDERVDDLVEPSAAPSRRPSRAPP